MRCENFIKWFGHLLYFMLPNFLCEGLLYKPVPGDSKHFSDILNSSPSLLNSTGALYSSWSTWSACSVTCGTGISSRMRTCLKSAHNSRGVYVPLCHGEYSEHKVCNLKACSENSDVREFQCLQYNNQVIAGKLVKTWIPAQGGPNPCELRCEARSEQLVYGFGKARDGTPCPFGVCLDGRCLRLGCDSRLGSGVDWDMCGVCGGRNSSCVHYKDVYEGQSSTGNGRSSYYEVVVIPYGARNLIIRQPLGKNILALQDRNKGIIFNGEQDEKKYGDHYEISGSVVEYRKLDVLAEQLLVKGPVTQELKVLVLLRSRNPGIYYEYWLSKQNRNPVQSRYPFRASGPPNLSTPSLRKDHPVSLHNPKPTVPTYVPNNHPTKPPFAYGFGDKPREGQESPIFRHILSTNSPGHQQYNPVTESSKTVTSKLHPPFKRGVFKPKPAEDYYATYRNASRSKELGSSHQAEAPSYDEGFRDFTLGDSSVSNGGNKFNSPISNTIDKKKHQVTLSRHPKPVEIGIPVSKQVNKVSNGRLKYSFEGKDTDEVYVNASGRYTPAPLTINVLPDGKNSRLRFNTNKDERLQKPRFTRGGICDPCQRSRDQLKHFCESDFVIHALVIEYEFVQGETRYELEVKQSFKNTFSLLSKEYVWSPDTCRCPKLRPGKEYIVMGRSDDSYRKRESRLLVDRSSFVRTFNPKYVRRLQKLRKEQQKKCRKFS